MKFRLVLTASVLALSALVVNSANAQQVVFADVGKNLEFIQTAPTTVVPLSSSNGFFFARTFYTVATDFDSGFVSYGGPGSPQGYNNTSPLYDCCGDPGAGYQTGYIVPADMTADFPNGSYTLTATNSVTLASETLTVDYGRDIYTAATPTFTVQTFNDLQNINPDAGVTLNFNTFVPADGSGAAAQGFFSIFDYTTNSYVVSGTNYSNFDPSLGTLSVGPNVLVRGDSYAAELIFDDYVAELASGTYDTFDQYGNLLTSDPVSGVQADYRSDMRTLIDFTVPLAVPEPATWAMLLLGFFGTGFMLRGARRKSAV